MGGEHKAKGGEDKGLGGGERQIQKRGGLDQHLLHFVTVPLPGLGYFFKKVE